MTPTAPAITRIGWLLSLGKDIAFEIHRVERSVIVLRRDGVALVQQVVAARSVLGVVVGL
jgi:hypothetical protein